MDKITCLTPGCDKPRGRYRKWCSTHKHKQNRHGAVRKRGEHGAGFGGPLLGGHWLDPTGYLVVRFCGHDVKVHRLVWVIDNGPIPKGFHVHHINENKLDNRSEYLRLVSPSEHKSIHMKMRWAARKSFLTSN